MKIILVCILLLVLIISACDVEEPKTEAKDSSMPVIGEEVKNVEESKQQESAQEEPVCSNECSGSGCSGFEFIDCVTNDNGCKEKENKGKVIEKCKVECLIDSDCMQGESCSISYRCVKLTQPLPQETKSTEPSESESEATESTLGDLKNALEELQDNLENQDKINKKIDECTKLCAGDDYSIPVIKNECYSACYQVYYYTGEEGLDEMIESYK